MRTYIFHTASSPASVFREAAVRRHLGKQKLLMILQNSEENAFTGVTVFQPRILLKKSLRHSCIVVKFGNFQEQCFYRTPTINRKNIYYNSTVMTLIGNDGLHDQVLSKTFFWQMWNRFLMFFTYIVVVFILQKVEGWTCLKIFLSLLLCLCLSWPLNRRFGISILNHA